MIANMKQNVTLSLLFQMYQEYGHSNVLYGTGKEIIHHIIHSTSDGFLILSRCTAAKTGYSLVIV